MPHRRGSSEPVCGTAGLQARRSAEVAELGFKAFKENKRVEVTGLRNRMVAAAVPFLPRSAVLSVVRNLQSPL